MQLSEEQRMIRDSVHDFVQEKVAPFAADWDRDSHFPREQLNEMAALGLFGMFIPPEWGGSGTDYLSFALAIEEVAAGDGACSTILSVFKANLPQAARLGYAARLFLSDRTTGRI